MLHHFHCPKVSLAHIKDAKLSFEEILPNRVKSVFLLEKHIHIM